MPAYNAFTERLRTAIRFANRESLMYRSRFTEPEHLLLGVAREGTSVGAKRLAKLGMTARCVRRQIEAGIKDLDEVLYGRNPAGFFEWRRARSPEAERVMDHARAMADALGREDVDVDHLAVALLVSGAASVAAMCLDLKIDPARAIDAVLERMGVDLDTNAKQSVLSYATPGQYDRPDDKQVYQVGIVGITGYGGGEALRLCATHPAFHVVYAAGESSAGQALGEHFPGISPDLARLVIQKWDAERLPDLDVLFASLPSGESREALAKVRPATRIVDIGGDHRFADGWVYGLADVWPDRIRHAMRVANPGCYPAASLAALAPLAANKLIDPATIIIDAKSGVSGAGRGGGNTFGFAEVNEDVSAYGLFKHAHVPEMTQAISQLIGAPASLTFTPHLIPMTRGILSTCYARGNATTEQCVQAARAFYEGRPFVRVLDKPPHSKWATGSNLAYVSYATDPARGMVIAIGAIDNLGKGAAGQAVQNANLMLGLEETLGLEGSPLWP